MIRVLTGLDRLVDSDKDVQVHINSARVMVVTIFDEFYIEDIEDAEVLHDALGQFIAHKRGMVAS